MDLQTLIRKSIGTAAIKLTDDFSTETAHDQRDLEGYMTATIVVRLSEDTLNVTLLTPVGVSGDTKALRVRG